jgi:hypothetical protein
MVSTREFEDRGVLVIESRELSYWIEHLDEDVREWWRTEGKTALNAGEFNVLCQEPFLKPLLRRVLDDSEVL